MAQANWMRGSITSIPKGKSFCFITGDEDGQDRFAHQSVFESSVDLATIDLFTRVEFISGESDRGPRAEAVRVLDREQVDNEHTDRISGVVTSVKNDRGYCFLTSDTGMEKIFAHRSTFRNRPFDDLSPGDRVEFKLSQGEQGPRAVDVVVTE
jgi:CspA family cold shock protein